MHLIRREMRKMKIKLLALFLMAVALVSTGCMASVRYNPSVRYNRGYDRYQYGPAYRYDRDGGRHERYRDHRHNDRRDYPHGNRYDGRR